MKRPLLFLLLIGMILGRSGAITAPEPPLTLFDSVRALRVARVLPTEVELHWQDTSDGKAAFRVERKTGAGTAAYEQLALLPPGVTVYRDTTVTPRQSCVYRVVPVLRSGPVDVRGGDPAAELEIPLKGVGEILLETRAGPDNNFHDHCVFASPALETLDGQSVSLSTLGKPTEGKAGYGELGDFKTISIGGVAHPESLLLHAPGFVRWRLEKQYRRLTTQIGVDDREGTYKTVGQYILYGIPSDSTLAALPTVALTTPGYQQSAGNTTYYVDAHAGRDTNDGKSPTRAWKTLDRANSTRFAGGDKLLFRAGTMHTGSLTPHGAGAKNKPFVMDRYGVGARPIINGAGRSRDAILLHNTEYVTLQNLEVTNKGPERIAGLTGVRLQLEDFGTAHNITVRNLYIHDIYGSNVKSAGGGTGIVWDCGGKKIKSRFDGVVIEKNHLVRTDRNGIVGGSAYLGRGDWYPSLRVAIRHNLLEDIGGDGIVPIGTDGCVVEHNRIKGARTRAEDYAAGIWPWAADNTLIQYNEVSGVKGTKDGQGFDADWNCRGTIIQFNYSHDNEGGFLLVCNDGSSGKGWNAGNVNAIIRYNVSFRDGGPLPYTRIFHISGPVEGVKIYHNTIYVGAGHKAPMVLLGNWGGWPKSVLFANNIFVVADGGEASYDLRPESRMVRYRGNLYYGNQGTLPPDPKARLSNPQFVGPIPPPNASNGFAALKAFALRSGSPARGAATVSPGLTVTQKPADLGAIPSGVATAPKKVRSSGRNQVQ